jgi:hypothetical protein
MQRERTGKQGKFQIKLHSIYTSGASHGWFESDA